MDKNESFAERMMRKQGWNKGEGKLVSLGNQTFGYLSGGQVVWQK